MDPIDRRLMLGAAGLAGVAALSKFGGVARAGPLDPPAGPIAPTGKTTAEVFDRVEAAEALLRDRIARTDAGVAEPRTPVQSLEGSVTASYVISEPGSYCLVDNIVGAKGKDAIEIAADGVDLDLCGFSLLGTETDTAAVRVASGHAGVRVHGGALTRWNQALAASGAEALWIDGVTALSLGYGTQPVRAAFELGRFGRMSHCGVHRSRWNAVEPGQSSVVEDCIITNGSNAGIVTFDEEVIVRRCTVRGHPGSGISLFQSGTVEDCRVDYCQFGVSIEQRGRALRNICTYNAIGVRVLFLDCVVQGNIVQRNSIGVEVVNAGNLVMGNIARENTSNNYSISAGNAYGPIVNVSGAGDISSIAAAAHPWANFVY